MADYRIEYQIQRRNPDADDYVEIGFGSSGEWNSLDFCAHMLSCAIEHGEWETEDGQPDPASVMDEGWEADHG